MAKIRYFSIIHDSSFFCCIGNTKRSILCVGGDTMETEQDVQNTIINKLGKKYRKTLLINLTDDSFKIGNLADDEKKAIKELNISSLSEYWSWFCNSELLHEDDREECKAFDFKKQADILYRRKLDGEWCWMYMEIVPLDEDVTTDDIRTLSVREVDGIYKREYDTIVEKIGTTDNFTGLLNKYAFERDKLKHKNEKVGIIYLDLNGLKYANDNFGHKAGDDLILQLSSLMLLNFPSYKCYHLSGDEFLVCAYNQSLREFLVKALAFHKSMWWSMEHPIASMGYAIGEEGELELAYDEAEKEMYDDKRIFYMRFPKYKRK